MSSFDPAPVQTDSAPRPVGPYGQAVRHGDVLYCSGQVPIDPATGELIDGPLGEQARRCLQNLAAVCEAAGTGLDRAIRLTVYVIDLGEFGAVNAAFERELGSHRPARATVEVAALPLGAEVEIDAIVAIPPAPRADPS